MPLQGGLAGLLLRLRQDGHGELAAFGPAGIAAHARALRHLVRWRHPALKVCEVDPLDPPIIYQVGVWPLGRTSPHIVLVCCEGVLAVLIVISKPYVRHHGANHGSNACLQDERLAVVAIWQPSLLWTPPVWLTTAETPRRSSAAGSAPAVTPGKVVDSDTETSSSSSSSTRANGAGSSGDSADSEAKRASEPMSGSACCLGPSRSPPQNVKKANVLANRARSGGESGSSSSDSDSDSESDSSTLPQEAVTPPWASADVFAELDQAFAASAGVPSRRRAMDLLQRGVGRPPDMQDNAALKAEFLPSAAGDNPVHIRARASTAGAGAAVAAG